jgi:hypothetical protein
MDMDGNSNATTGSSIEDIRKKRDNREVVEGNSFKSDEKTKKLKAQKLKTCTSHDKAPTTDEKTSTTKEIRNGDDENDDASAITGVVSSISLSNNNSNELTESLGDIQQEKFIDFETALNRIVRVSDGVREYVTDDSWLTFRIAHAGDASILATCVRKSNSYESTKDDNNSSSNINKTLSSSTAEDTSLEVRLAEGLGDEDTPPSIFALLCDINTQNDEAKLAAACMFYMVWEEFSRVLLLECLFVDDTENSKLTGLIERRVWLRLCTLAKMTSCEKIIQKQRDHTI